LFFSVGLGVLKGRPRVPHGRLLHAGRGGGDPGGRQADHHHQDDNGGDNNNDDYQVPPKVAAIVFLKSQNKLER